MYAHALRMYDQYEVCWKQYTPRRSDENCFVFYELSPRIYVCCGRPLHYTIVLRSGQGSTSDPNGLDDNFVMSRSFIAPESFYVCNVLERGGICMEV